MKIGIVGYQGSGKSSLFEYVTGNQVDPSLSHTSQIATAVIPEPRVQPLCDIYQPKKTVQASLNIVDTPGLGRSQDGNAAKLAQMREVGCLIVVIAGFGDNDPSADLQSFAEDLLLTDMEMVSNRVTKLRESVKKPRPNRESEKEELEALEPVLEQLELGKSIRDLELSDKQARCIKAFQLLTSKPMLFVINVDDMQNGGEVLNEIKKPEGFDSAQEMVAFSISLQLELGSMQEDERKPFCEEMGVTEYDRDTFIQKIMDISGQMLFFTAGEQEVRTWLIAKGATAGEAAGSIHSDLERGFVRAETMSCDDLFRLGSEREIKANNLMRKEHKDYVIQDGDILHILATT